MRSTLFFGSQIYKAVKYVFLMVMCSVYSFDTVPIVLCDSSLIFRFYARDSGFLKFRIYAGATGRTAAPARRLVAFTFHPTDPFAISVQRTNAEYIVNFHIRYDKSDSDNDDTNVLNFL